jgi:hypothetical protein
LVSQIIKAALAAFFVGVLTTAILKPKFMSKIEKFASYFAGGLHMSILA